MFDFFLCAGLSGSTVRRPREPEHTPVFMSRADDFVPHLLGCTHTHTHQHISQVCYSVPKLRKFGLEQFITLLNVCDAKSREAVGTKGQKSLFFLLFLGFVMAFLFFSCFMFGMAVLAAPLFCLLFCTAAAAARGT